MREWQDLSDDELRVRLERRLYTADKSYIDKLIRGRDNASFFAICEIMEDE